jgi:hypothetical protein
MYKATITTDCTCQAVDDNGDYIENENGEPVLADRCRGGDCWDYQVEDINEAFLPMWTEKVGIDKTDLVDVSSKSTRWTHEPFRAITQLENILAVLYFGNDYTLEFELDGSSLTVVRYSHDEPTGASFVIKPYKADN